METTLDPVAAETVQKGSDQAVAPSATCSALIRVGPQVKSMNDISWLGHPLRTFWSCQGCQFAQVSELGSRCCTHPKYLQEYGSKQYFGQNFPGLLDIHPDYCPELERRGIKGWPEPLPTQPRYAVRVRNVRRYLDAHRPDYVARYGYSDNYAKEAKGCTAIHPKEKTHEAWLTAKRTYFKRLARCSWDEPNATAMARPEQ